MTAKNKTTTKFISALLVVSMLAPAFVSFFAPKQSNAQSNVPVADFKAETSLSTIARNTPVITVKTTLSALLQGKGWAQKLLELALMAIARAVLAKLTQATINWINSDFHGSPLFLENPASFFKDIAKSQIRGIVDMIGHDLLRFPFGPQTALNIINSYKNQLAINAQYTLSNAITNPALLVAFREDFNVGGWNGFLLNTQYPQNNYLGFQMIIQDDLASRLAGTVQAPAEQVQSLLQQGMGFLSPQMCMDPGTHYNDVMANAWQRPSFTPPTYTPPPITSSDAEFAASYANYDASVATAKADWAKTNTCQNLVNTTPGSVAANQIMMAMGSSFRQTELAAALGNSLSAIFDALITHFLDKGLNALSSVVNPAPPADNWSYNGQTLSGDTIPAGAKLPTVTVSVGGTNTSKTVINTDTRPSPSFTIVNYQDNIATVTIDSAGRLTIKGVSPGTALATITDSLGKITQVQVTVNPIGGLAVSPGGNINLNLDKKTSENLTISGGTGPYIMTESPDESIALAVFSPDGSLVVSSVAPGDNTTVTIEDSSITNDFCPSQRTGPCTITIPITVTGSSGTTGLLTVSNSDLTVVAGSAPTSVTVSGGTGSYSATPNDNTIATATVSGNTIKITGIANARGGTYITSGTYITISDSATPPNQTQVYVNVTPRIDPVDAKRLADLEIIQNALDAYKTAKGNYPNGTVYFQAYFQAPPYAQSNWTSLGEMLQPYLKDSNGRSVLLPTDSNGYFYITGYKPDNNNCQITASGVVTDYSLGTRMDNTSVIPNSCSHNFNNWFSTINYAVGK